MYEQWFRCRGDSSPAERNRAEALVDGRPATGGSVTTLFLPARSCPGLHRSAPGGGRSTPIWPERFELHRPDDRPDHRYHHDPEYHITVTKPFKHTAEHQDEAERKEQSSPRTEKSRQRGRIFERVRGALYLPPMILARKPLNGNARIVVVIRIETGRIQIAMWRPASRIVGVHVDLCSQRGARAGIARLQQRCKSWASPLGCFAAFEEQETEAHGKYAKGEHADRQSTRFMNGTLLMVSDLNCRMTSPPRFRL